jgi:hypothetical protein
MGRNVRSIAAFGVAGVMLAACGGGYKGLSKADFVSKADAICTSGQKKLDAISSALGTSPKLSDVQKVYKNQFATSVQAEVTQLRALKPPKADRKTISTMLDNLSTGIDQVTAEVTSAKTLQDVGALKEPKSLTAADKTANSYGLKACGGAN